VLCLDLKDPKPKEAEKKSGPTRVDDRGRDEQRSMRLNDAFDNFRREIEGATNPWSTMLDRRFPIEIGMLRPILLDLFK
jgi:hypothetical protein